jgi:hypothetical protein
VPKRSKSGWAQLFIKLIITLSLDDVKKFNTLTINLGLAACGGKLRAKAIPQAATIVGIERETLVSESPFIAGQHVWVEGRLVG